MDALRICTCRLISGSALAGRPILQQPYVHGAGNRSGRADFWFWKKPMFWNTSVILPESGILTRNCQHGRRISIENCSSFQRPMGVQRRI